MVGDGALWEIVDGESPLYRAEARDYVSRLVAAVPIDPSARVLDFGCGLGFAALGLSSHVREVCLWDSSPHMRALAARNTAACDRARVLAAPPGNGSGPEPFDLVVLNSVLQYVDDASAGELLRALGAVLSAGGSIVVSDVVTPESSVARELAQLLRFGVQQHLTLDLLREQVRVARWYAASRRPRPGRRWTRDDLRRLAATASLATEFLPANLTFRTERLAAVMRSTAAPLR
jgi:SAM-dependent methyltransferase